MNFREQCCLRMHHLTSRSPGKRYTVSGHSRFPMPYPFDSDWSGPDIFVEHKGVIVYHCYNGDEIGPAHETYEFSLNTTCGNRRCTCGARCRFQFDIRTLPNHKEWPKPLTVDEPGSSTEWNKEAWQFYFASMAAFHREVICAAVDFGYLTPEGVRLPHGSHPKNVN
jgi:hypothetical protein